MRIPHLRSIFSTFNHSVEEDQFSSICWSCNQACSLRDIQSVETEGLRTYHCDRCMAVLATVSDPSREPAMAECYRISGWAVRPVATLSIALEVSSISVPPKKAFSALVRPFAGMRHEQIAAFS